MKLDMFTTAYVEAALWSSTDDICQPLDRNYSVADIAPTTLAVMVADCAKFQSENDLSECGDSQAGHDFWLTRNGHGAGFWDGDWPETGDALTEAAKAYPVVELYVGDDGRIWA